jgi:hypothetical protein
MKRIEDLDQYKIAVVVSGTSFPQSTNEAWRNAAVELIGPISPSDFDRGRLQALNGVLIHAAEEAKLIFEISSALEEAGTPFLFVLLEDDLDRAEGVFVLSGHPDDIRCILDNLLLQTDTGVRH